jgi:hypothetical protein
MLLFLSRGIGWYRTPSCLLVGMTSRVSAAPPSSPNGARAHDGIGGETGRGMPDASRAIWRTTAFCEQSGPNAVAAYCSTVRHGPFLLCLFPQHCAARAANHRAIGLPKIGETVTCTIRQRDGLPPPTTRCLAAIPYRVGDHLSRFAAQRNPDPGWVCLLQHKGPQLIQF